MGGWCAQRDHCAHYHTVWRGQPSERLCMPGRDGVSHVVEVHARTPITDLTPSTLPSQEVGA